MGKQEVKPAEKPISDSGGDLALIRKFLAMSLTPLRPDNS